MSYQPGEMIGEIDHQAHFLHKLKTFKELNIELPKDPHILDYCCGAGGTVYGVSLIVEIFYGLMSEMNIQNSEYILLLSIIHLLDIIGYKIFNVDYFVTIFGNPEIIKFPMSIIIGLYALLFSSFIAIVNYIISRMEVTK